MGSGGGDTDWVNKRHLYLFYPLIPSPLSPSPPPVLCCAGALERLLAVVRAVLGVLSDVLRPTGDTQDTPLCLLGEHLVTRRDIGERLT